MSRRCGELATILFRRSTSRATAVDARAIEHLPGWRRGAPARATGRSRWTGRPSRGLGALSTSRPSEWAVWCSRVNDMHYGAKDNLIMPGRATTMADGWETRRRRGPGHDWAILTLGAPGHIERIEIDTNHFKGNYPESASIEACDAPGAPALTTLASSRPGRRFSREPSCTRPPALFEGQRRSARLARPAEHLSRRRRQPAPRPWNRGSRLTRARTTTRACCTDCCGSTRWVERMMAAGRSPAETALSAARPRGWRLTGRLEGRVQPPSEDWRTRCSPSPVCRDAASR